MNISHELQCILIHVPKTGGNSIKNIFNIKGHAHKPVSHHDTSMLQEYFTFAFTRNPWDRFVSSYFYLKEGGMGRFDQRAKKKYIDRFSSFSEFVKNVDYEDLTTNQIHFRQQSYYLDNTIDYIGKYEDIQAGIDFVCDSLSIHRVVLPHKNKSSHANYRKYYDNETREIVERIYNDDITLFGYTFGG